MILAVRDLKQSYWLVYSAADIYIYNDKRLMTDQEENPTKVQGSNLDNISPNKVKIKIRLVLEDGSKGLILTLTNLSHNLLNLISLGLLNNIKIFYHNNDQILYNKETQKILAYIEQYNTSFFLYLLNLLVIAISFLKTNDIYKSEKPNVYQI